MADNSIEAFKEEYRKDKYKKALKHRNSKVLHPIKTTKNSYNNVSNMTSNLWSKGKQLGQDRIHGNYAKYSSDKQIAKYTYKHTSLTQKIVIVLVVVFVLAMIVMGAIQ